MKKIYILLVIVMLTFIACSKNDEVKIAEESLTNESNMTSEIDLTFQGELTRINERRKLLAENELQMNDYMYTSESNNAFTEDEIILLLENKKPLKQLLLKEEAIEDVERLFKIFKYEYAAYIAFGGDEIFNQAKDNIMDELNGVDELYISDLEKIIIEELDFINDGHLRIGNTNIGEAFTRKYYSNEKLSFHKDSKGYYLAVEDEKRYIHSINGDLNVHDSMRLSIDENGQLVYYLGIMRTDGPVVEKLQIEYTSGGNLISEEIELFKATSANNYNKATYEEEIINGIPLITLRRCDDLANETLLKNFVASGSKYRDDQVLIIDLRGNSGGSSVWGDLWFKNYTQQMPGKGGLNIARIGSINEYMLRVMMAENHNYYLDKYEMPELLEYVEDFYVSIKDILNGESDSQYKVDDLQYKIVNNKNTIFVLIDKGVASSGEDFLLNLRSIDNVVVVGSNTRGASDVLSMINLQLPNSRLNIFIGFSLNVKQESPHFFDGVGIEPDIWLANFNMMDRLMKLIDLNSLNMQN